MLLKFTVAKSGQVSRRTWNETMKAVYATGAEHWFDRFSARHFTVQGARLYGYAPRSKKYTARKRREKHHSNPLVWSGASRVLATIKNIRSTRTGGKAVIAAHGLNRPHRYGKFRMREEMTRLTENETRSIVAMMRKRLEVLLKEAGTKKTKE